MDTSVEDEVTPVSQDYLEGAERLGEALKTRIAELEDEEK